MRTAGHGEQRPRNVSLPSQTDHTFTYSPATMLMLTQVLGCICRVRDCNMKLQLHRQDGKRKKKTVCFNISAPWRATERVALFLFFHFHFYFKQVWSLFTPVKDI